MVRSNIIIDMMPATVSGVLIALNKPQPCSLARRATPMGAKGKIMRTSTLLRKVNVKFPNHRVFWGCVSLLRGYAVSHKAISAKTALKKPSRTRTSLSITNIFIVNTGKSLRFHSFKVTLILSNSTAGRFPPEQICRVFSTPATFFRISYIFPATITSFR